MKRQAIKKIRVGKCVVTFFDNGFFRINGSDVRLIYNTLKYLKDEGFVKKPVAQRVNDDDFETI